MRNKVIIAILISNLVFYGTVYAEFYRYNVDDLARKAKQRILEIEKKIEEEEVTGELAGILKEIKGLFNEAEELYSQRKYENAGKLYSEIDKIGRKSEVRKTLEKAAKY